MSIPGWYKYRGRPMRRLPRSWSSAAPSLWRMRRCSSRCSGRLKQHFALALKLFRFLRGERDAVRGAVVALTTVLNVGLLLVDHVHFQYNGFLFAMLFLALAALKHVCYLCHRAAADGLAGQCAVGRVLVRRPPQLQAHLPLCGARVFRVHSARALHARCVAHAPAHTLTGLQTDRCPSLASLLWAVSWRWCLPSPSARLCTWCAPCMHLAR